MSHSCALKMAAILFWMACVGDIHFRASVIEAAPTDVTLSGKYEYLMESKGDGPEVEDMQQDAVDSLRSVYQLIFYERKHKRHHESVTQKSTTSTIETSTPSEASSVRDDDSELTTWSIAWYLTLLAAFVVFFVMIGLMEIFCRRRNRGFIFCGGSRGNPTRSSDSICGSEREAPPPYDLFKPPSYNTLFPAEQMQKIPEKIQEVEEPPEDQLIYIINVHGGRGVS